MGQSDSALSEVGKTEAAEAVTALQAHPIDMIVCSPLTRCLMTISPFRATGDHEFVLEPKLAERSWGIYEGVPKWPHRKVCSQDYSKLERNQNMRYCEAFLMIL